MPRPKKNPTTDNFSHGKGGYIFADSSPDALKSYSSVVDSFDGVTSQKVHAEEIITDTHVRQPFSREDYDWFRPGEAVPKKFKDTVKLCRSFYKSVGMVRNIIDLMVDFTCEDLEIIHTDLEKQIFFNVWAKKVQLQDRVESFVKNLLVDGNTVVKRVTGKLTKPVENEWVEKSLSAPDQKLKTKDNTPDKREIPIRYIFLDVVNLSWNHDDISILTGDRKLSMSIPRHITSIMKNKDTSIYQSLPQDMRTKLGSGDSIQLDMDKIYYTSLRKDDWESWGTPLLYGIIPDVFYKNKLRLAEVSALDGVINVIRIWKLGDHNLKIFPDVGAIDHLRDIITANPGGGALDIIWDSMIDMKDYYPPIDKILGAEKYTQVNSDILTGLGIPEVLIGGRGSNFSNSFIQLKTLVEKLKGYRNRVLDWVNNETSMVCHAMGWKKAPLVRFKEMNLHDENVSKRLIVGLLDRGIISVESVLEVYGQDFSVEIERIRREEEKLKEYNIDKFSPFDASKKLSSDDGGRPSDTKDVGPRDRKANPQTASIDIPLSFVNIFDKVYVPEYVKSIGKKNLRQLTSEEKSNIDNVRRYFLASLTPDSSVTEENIFFQLEHMNQVNTKLLSNLEKSYDSAGPKSTVTDLKTRQCEEWCRYFNKNSV